jgi:hypothetical protein
MNQRELVRCKDSVGLSSVNLIGEPSNHVAKSSLKFSAMNLQILSYMAAFKKIVSGIAMFRFPTSHKLSGI